MQFQDATTSTIGNENAVYMMGPDDFELYSQGNFSKQVVDVPSSSTYIGVVK